MPDHTRRHYFNDEPLETPSRKSNTIRDSTAVRCGCRRDADLREGARAFRISSVAHLRIRRRDRCPRLPDLLDERCRRQSHTRRAMRHECTLGSQARQLPRRFRPAGYIRSPSPQCSLHPAGDKRAHPPFARRLGQCQVGLTLGHPVPPQPLTISQGAVATAPERTLMPPSGSSCAIRAVSR